MPKERINVTVDPGVKEELRVRDDINVSGAVNGFLRRYLRGEGADEAAKRIEIERKRDRAERLREKAGQLDREADALEQDLKQEREERRERVEAAINELSFTEMKSVDGPVISESDDRIEALAQQADIPVDELVREAKDRHSNEQQSKRDPTYQ